MTICSAEFKGVASFAQSSTLSAPSDEETFHTFLRSAARIALIGSVINQQQFSSKREIHSHKSIRVLMAAQNMARNIKTANLERAATRTFRPYQAARLIKDQHLASFTKCHLDFFGRATHLLSSRLLTNPRKLFADLHGHHAVC
ncbi:MAG: hypothetical protein ACXV96_11750, partial [Candidatus Angelobacter sp.]